MTVLKPPRVNTLDKQLWEKALEFLSHQQDSIKSNNRPLCKEGREPRECRDDVLKWAGKEEGR